MTDFAPSGQSVGVTSMGTAVRPLPAPLAPRPALALAPDFEALYGTNFGFVWRNLRRLGVPRSSLDDATQDAFVVAFRRLSDFVAGSSFRAWLAGITVRVAADYRRQVRRKGGIEPLDDTLVDRRPGPDARAAHFEALRQIDSLLSMLDDEKRETFVLSELEGMTAPEIAVATNTNLNTVYSRLRAARSAFEDSLQRLERGDR
jgi:RNA polymerase sigma-70 factor, ECF subfamily